LKKSIAIVLAFLLLSALVPQGVLANVTPLDSLTEVENILYGSSRTGALLERIEDVETDIYGSVQEGAVLLRIARIQKFLTDTGGTGGLQLFLNLAEWGFSSTMSTQLPFLQRLEELEVVLYGTVQEGFIAKRAEELMEAIWGTTKLDVKQVTLPARTLVKIALLETVDSANNQIGDPVLYRVAEDVMVDGRIVIPAGTIANGTVAEVTSAGRLGKDGRILLEFNRVTALDGTLIGLKVDETATQRNKSLELAAGASMAGIVLLGPVGLVGGYFIKGKDVAIEKNLQFYVETTKAINVSGFHFRPASY